MLALIAIAVGLLAGGFVLSMGAEKRLGGALIALGCATVALAAGIDIVHHLGIA